MPNDRLARLGFSSRISEPREKETYGAGKFIALEPLAKL